jgi:hypothetical protein
MYHPAMDSDTDSPTRPVSSRCVAIAARGAGTSQSTRSQITAAPKAAGSAALNEAARQGD